MRFVGEGAILCNVLHVPTKPSSTADCLVLASTVENRPLHSEPDCECNGWRYFASSDFQRLGHCLSIAAAISRSASVPSAILSSYASLAYRSARLTCPSRNNSCAKL